MATRASAGGWVNSTIQVPGSLAASYYQGFSDDLSVGILSAGSAAEPSVQPLSPRAPGDGYPVLYACSDSERPCEAQAGGASTPENPFRPLYGKPENRAPGEFGTHEVYSVGINEEQVAVFAGGSAGFGDLLFEANKNCGKT
jgi:hypothetical protein